MFTGIVEEVGSVANISDNALTVRASKIIEDMKLEGNSSFKKVIVAALMIENADGTPCTIFGYPV